MATDRPGARQTGEPGARRNPENAGAPDEIDWEREPENVALDLTIRALADAAPFTHSTLVLGRQRPV